MVEVYEALQLIKHLLAMFSEVFWLRDLHRKDFIDLLVSIVVLNGDHSSSEHQEDDECGVNTLEQDSLHRLVPPGEHLKQTVDREDPRHFPEVYVISLDNILVLDDVKTNQKNRKEREVEN